MTKLARWTETGNLFKVVLSSLWEKELWPLDLVQKDGILNTQVFVDL